VWARAPGRTSENAGARHDGPAEHAEIRMRQCGRRGRWRSGRAGGPVYAATWRGRTPSLGGAEG
jgi:hypothetical protein